MRMFNKIWGFSLIVLFMALASPNKSIAQGYVTDQDFYDELSPYGTWVYDPDYGNVWVPDVEDGFQPYGTRGHWVMTSYGNTWVSDYDWGWAPFHYGRWRFDNYYGWTWVPGYEWAPAWVTWRQGGGYYGWAPLMPGLSINVNFGGYNIPNNYWVFAPEAYIGSYDIYNYYVPYNNRVTIINRTTYINNTYVYNNRTYYSGPRADDIRRSTGRDVRVYSINNTRRPVSGGRSVRDNSLNIYRPAIRKVDNAKPARVVDGSAYRRANPAARIADPSKGFSSDNAQRLARTARTEKPENNIVRVNNDRPESRTSRRVERTTNPDANVNRGGVRNADNNNNNVVRQRNNDNGVQNGEQRGRRQQQGDVQRQPVVQQRDQQTDVVRQSQDQARGQRNRQQRDEQMQAQRDQQQEQQRREMEQQRQQRDQQQEQQRQQRNQQLQAQRQQQEQQRQQMEQQRQQRDQQLQAQRQQQQEQQRQQMEQQRQQRDQQIQAQRQQQQEQQRQQVQQRQQQQQQPRNDGGGRGRRN